MTPYGKSVQLFHLLQEKNTKAIACPQAGNTKCGNKSI